MRVWGCRCVHSLTAMPACSIPSTLLQHYLQPVAVMCHGLMRALMLDICLWLGAGHGPR
jgi:hypothetical protein